MRIKIHQINLLFISILSLLLSACIGDNSDLVKYINETKTRPVKIIDPIPHFAALPTFRFPESDVRRNPFKPLDQQKRIDLYAPDQKRTKQPLEMFPLDALKFVGTLTQGDVTWALIKQPDQQVRRIKVGDYIGLNYGHVLLIKNDLIKLEETIKSLGTWEKQITTVNLYTSK